jgi:ABC-type transport system involved in cytochrome c biogenesis permease component
MNQNMKCTRPRAANTMAIPNELISQIVSALLRFRRSGLLIPILLPPASWPVISPAHKRTEGRVPVWGSEFTSKYAALQGGSSRNRC